MHYTLKEVKLATWKPRQRPTNIALVDDYDIVVMGSYSARVALEPTIRPSACTH
jgi:hypothetical protein